jgi:hypothetical protein
MKAKKWIPATMAVGTIALLATQTGCEEKASASTGIDPKIVADSLFTVMEADRASYTTHVIKRIKAEGLIDANEYWEDSGNKNLPLPAQMFRMAAERAKDSKHNTAGFFYQLKSPWPVNKQNKPVTDVEKEGFDFIVANKGEAPFYGEEVLDGKKYFTAIYADVAVSSACVDCHNGHEDTPKTDFALGDVMGGVVLRIPM